MKVGSVSLKRVRLRALRLNAGSYLSEDQELADAIRLWPRLEPLGERAIVFRGPIFARHYVGDEQYGLPYVSASDMDRTDYWGVRLISGEHGDLLAKLALHAGMSVVACSGINLGWSMRVRPDMEGVVGSHDLIRVTARNVVDSGYLSAFLASRLGWISIRTTISGGSVKHVEPDDLNAIDVPWPEESIRREIGEAFTSAASLRAASNKLIGMATEQVFSSNDCVDLSESEWYRQGRELGFSARISSHSFRAWNYSPKANALRDTIQSRGARPLVEWCVPNSLRKGPSFKRLEASGEHAVPLIGQRQLFRFNPRPKSVARAGVPKSAFCSVGTTLIATRGTFGESEVFCRAQWVSRVTSGWLFSNDITRVVPASQEHAGWLYAYLRSRTAFRLLRSLATGSKQQDLHPRGLEALPVLLGTAQGYRVVNELVGEAFRLRDEAYTLEGLATSRLEQLTRDAL